MLDETAVRLICNPLLRSTLPSGRAFWGQCHESYSGTEGATFSAVAKPGPGWAT